MSHTHDHKLCCCQEEGCPAEEKQHSHPPAGCACHEDDCPAATSCCCAHEEAANGWKLWLPIAGGALLWGIGYLFSGTLRLALQLLAYGLLGLSVLWEAAKELGHGRVFGESFLMSIATIGALAIGDVPEAVAVMLFYRVGEYFQEQAVERSRRSIEDVIDLRPDHARLLKDGTFAVTDPAEVQPGDTILIEPGERVPLDGVILSGDSRLDTSAITGESVPVHGIVDVEVMAGSVNQTSPLTIRVTRVAAESATGRIMAAVEDAAKGKPRLENFITRFSRIYTPVVVGLALLLALLPPLLGMGAFSQWLHRGLLFLVASCPCALVLSVPLTFFAGLARASASGVLFKGANRMEALSRVKAAVMDKTGTLTRGVFAVQQVLPAPGFTGEELLQMAAAVEQHSLHPVAEAIRQAAGSVTPAEDISEQAGHGVTGSLGGNAIAAGNLRLMERQGITVAQAPEGTAVHVAKNGCYMGCIVIADELKPDAASAVKRLNSLCGYTAMLTGDSAAPARNAAVQAGVTEVKHSLLPEQKLTCMREIRNNRGEVLFVGDGVNDAPVLSGADVGMAIGVTGTDTAVEAADVVLLSQSLTAIPEAIEISRRTIRIANGNIWFAIGVKAVVMILGATGLASMWMAVFADVGTALLCVINGMRLLPRKRPD